MAPDLKCSLSVGTIAGIALAGLCLLILAGLAIYSRRTDSQRQGAIKSAVNDDNTLSEHERDQDLPDNIILQDIDI